MTAAIFAFVVLFIVVVVKFTGVGGSIEVGEAPGRVGDWQSLAKEAGSRYGLPWQILLAMIWQESSGDPEARGSAGEVGLMQLKQIAIDDLQATGYGTFPSWKSAPRSNIMAGAAYLDLQMKRTDGNLRKALGAYNQGYEGSKTNVTQAQRYASEVLQKAQKIGYDGQ